MSCRGFRSWGVATAPPLKLPANFPVKNFGSSRITWISGLAASNWDEWLSRLWAGWRLGTRGREFTSQPIFRSWVMVVLHWLWAKSISFEASNDEILLLVSWRLLWMYWYVKGVNSWEGCRELVCSGVYGVGTFQGCRGGVGKRIVNKWVPFVVVVNCSNHKTNLVVKILTKYSMVSPLEARLQSLYRYFCRSNMRHSKLQKLSNRMETKGNKVIQNGSTRWISMKTPVRRVLAQYRTLIAKMGLWHDALPW